MATTTTTQTNGSSGLAQRAALGLLASIPTTNPGLKVIQKALPHLPNIQSLGNGLSSAMNATQPPGTGVQNPNTNQNNMCDVRGKPAAHFCSLAHPLHFTELPHATQVARSRLWSVARVLFEDLREGEPHCRELRGMFPRRPPKHGFPKLFLFSLFLLVALQSPSEVSRWKGHSSILLSNLRQRFQGQQHS